MAAVGTSEHKRLLGGTVEESRAKRVEKQQSRYRDRGGCVRSPACSSHHGVRMSVHSRVVTRHFSIFKPAEKNGLLDVLLARGVNGESPVKARRGSMRRSRSASPSKKRTKTSDTQHTTGSGDTKHHTKARRQSSRRSRATGGDEATNEITRRGGSPDPKDVSNGALRLHHPSYHTTALFLTRSRREK